MPIEGVYRSGGVAKSLPVAVDADGRLLTDASGSSGGPGGGVSFVGAAAPTGTAEAPLAEGMAWYDTANNQLKYYDVATTSWFADTQRGIASLSITNTPATVVKFARPNASPPATGAEGDIWYVTDQRVLRIYNNASAWVPYAIDYPELDLTISSATVATTDNGTFVIGSLSLNTRLEKDANNDTVRFRMSSSTIPA